MRFLSICLIGILALGVVFVSAPKVYADRIDDLERRIAELESEKAPEKGFLSKKGAKVEISGGAEIEFVNVEDANGEQIAADATSEVNDSENPKLQVDKVTLRATVTSEDETIGFSTELELDEGDNAFFDDAYIFAKHIELGPTYNALKIGLISRYFEQKKIFESYPLGGFAWTEDEEYSAIYKGEYDDWLYWYGEVARANELNDKAPTESTNFELIHDNRRTSNTNEIGDHFAYGGGLGLKFDTGDLGVIDIMGFGRTGQNTDDDRAFLQGISGYGTSNSDDYTRAGVNVEYKIENFTVRGNYTAASDGRLDRDGWYVEPSYEFPVGWRYLESITPAAQLSWLDVDLMNTTADARTWDREKYTFGAVAKINKNLKWKNEISINDESTGDTEVDNDEFISQLQFKF